MFSILKNAGYSFNSDNFSMNPLADCHPLVEFVTLLIKQFSNNDLERAKGFLGVGINLSSDQISEIRKYMASQNINETDEMTKAFEELSQPKKTLKESEFWGDTESHKQLAELQSVLLDYEEGYPDKLKCFEKFERSTENVKLSDEVCLKYNQMLELFAKKHYPCFLNSTSDVKSLQDGFKLANKIKKHNPSILDNYAYSIKGPMFQTVGLSHGVSNPAVVRLTGLLSLRRSVYSDCIPAFKRFVNDAVKKTTPENANVDDSIEFLRVVMSSDRTLIGDENMAKLRENLETAVFSKDKREDDYINKMIGIGIKLTPKTDEGLDELNKKLEESYPDATWTIKDLYEMPAHLIYYRSHRVITMEESVKCRALEGFSYGWHANANESINKLKLQAHLTLGVGLILISSLSFKFGFLNIQCKDYCTLYPQVIVSKKFTRLLT